ncbi:MAG: 2-C-methyl-D-erythritol 4-phosphate cytidylyltransferase [Armatimonadetes bacterium]|nr:2-C-methyl-D-erythritol 4-phosphate cytidylyltransferase [Armatimonadota bacterium]
MSAAAVVVAAGLGRRMGTSTPKAFLDVAGKPLYAWSLTALLDSELFLALALVVPAGWETVAQDYVDQAHPAAPLTVCTGGQERPASVLAGIKAVAPSRPDLVAIHDGARPLLTQDLARRCLDAAAATGAAIAAAPCTDTLKEASDGVVARTLDRSKMWRAQTPQVFRLDLILRAYDAAHAAGFQATDDAALVERLGEPVALVPSDWTNLKVTTPADLVVAEALLRHRGLASH